MMKFGLLKLHDRLEPVAYSLEPGALTQNNWGFPL